MEEGYKKMTSQAEYVGPAKRNFGYVVPVAVAVIFGGLGFFGGVAYGKSGTTASSGASQMGQAGMGMGGQQQAGGFGTVTAISDTSITVSDQRQGSETTYTIASTTTVLDGTATATVADIAKGDQVMVQTASTTSKAATQITINPTMPSGGPGGQAVTGSTTN